MNTHLSSTREIILGIEDLLKTEIIGQDDLIRKLIITLFSGGHALIEGVPGLGKTKSVKSLAEILSYEFKRISFTPDLLPSDLTGTEIYRPETGKFIVRKGPIFTHILLADEINRTPPKVQSALLEAMEEGCVTIGNDTLDLPSPFFVIATQNPLEHEGTYPLPEAQLDRFFMKIIVSYPSPEDEIRIFTHASSKHEKSATKKEHLTPKELDEIQSFIEKNIQIDPKIYTYISDILEATRDRNEGHLTHPSPLEYGASTRAGLALIRGSRIVALLDGRDYVLPDDIKYLAFDILRHRIGLSYKSLGERLSPDTIIRDILEKVRIP